MLDFFYLTCHTDMTSTFFNGNLLYVCHQKFSMEDISTMVDVAHSIQDMRDFFHATNIPRFMLHV